MLPDLLLINRFRRSWFEGKSNRPLLEAGWGVPLKNRQKPRERELSVNMKVSIGEKPFF